MPVYLFVPSGIQPTLVSTIWLHLEGPCCREHFQILWYQASENWCESIIFVKTLLFFPDLFAPLIGIWASHCFLEVEDT